MTTRDFRTVSDATLLVETARAAAQERHSTVQLIALLGELDARRLYLGEGCSSLFTYCTGVLHLSEHAAYGRIEAARAARAYPTIVDLLAEGALTLTAVGLLRPHLTPENHRDVLEAARHKSKREVEELVARLHSKPAVPSAIRKLPARGSTRAGANPPDVTVPSISCAKSTPDSVWVASNQPPLSAPGAQAARPAVVKPLAPERYKIQFTVSADTHAKLRRAQDLLRHRVPTGDPAQIFELALSMLVEHLERTKLAATGRPRAPKRRKGVRASRSRHIPANVKREVWVRDGGQCAFVGTKGRCTETGFLEFHHVIPFADGGDASVENIQLRCRAHNQEEADRWFGPMMVRERGVPYVA